MRECGGGAVLLRLALGRMKLPLTRYLPNQVHTSRAGTLSFFANRLRTVSPARLTAPAPVRCVSGGGLAKNSGKISVCAESVVIRPRSAFVARSATATPR